MPRVTYSAHDEGADAFLPELPGPKEEKLYLQKIAEAAEFIERGALTEAQIAARLMRVSAAGRALLEGGLRRDTLLLLVQSKCRKRRNGDPVPLMEIENVLEAVEALHECVEQPKQEAPRRGGR